MRIPHIVRDLVCGLPLSRFRIDRFARALHNVGRAVKLGPVASAPERVKLDFFARAVRALHLFPESVRHHRRAETQPRKSRLLRIGAELDRTSSRALALVNRVRDIGLGDIGLIGRVKENHTAVFVGVIHPALKRFFPHDRAGRVIRRAEVNEVRCLPRRELRGKLIFRGTGQIGDARIDALRRIVVAASACHHIRVEIHGIDRVTDRYRGIEAENLLNISGVALCAVRNKNFIRTNLRTARLVVARNHLIPEKGIPVFRPVAAKALRFSHLIDRFVQRLNDSRAERLRHIADAHPDDALALMCVGKGGDLLRNRRKQIGTRKLQIIFVDSIHKNSFDAVTARNKKSRRASACGFSFEWRWRDSNP